jgi:hypothetical protein
MKEDRIIAFIGVYGSVILASTFKNIYLAGTMVVLAIIYFIKYTWLISKK